MTLEHQQALAAAQEMVEELAQLEEKFNRVDAAMQKVEGGLDDTAKSTRELFQDFDRLNGKLGEAPPATATTNMMGQFGGVKAVVGTVQSSFDALIKSLSQGGTQLLSLDTIVHSSAAIQKAFEAALEAQEKLVGKKFDLNKSLKVLTDAAQLQGPEGQKVARQMAFESAEKMASTPAEAAQALASATVVGFDPQMPSRNRRSMLPVQWRNATT